jgi:arabinan endo-1,5-alpha-L-arabinosidase
MHSKTGSQWLFTFILTVGVLAPSLVNAAPAYAHDPVITKEGSYYYLFSTGQGIPVRRSQDLRSWESLPPVFPTSLPWASALVPGFAGDFWAPDISFHEGTWYLYYSVSTFGINRSCIGLATNTTLDRTRPEYKWIDRGVVIGSVPRRDDWNAIDPNLVTGDGGGWYLVFGSFWSGIKTVRLDPSTGKPAEAMPAILSLARRPGVLHDPIEAPFIQRRNAFYYLYVSFDYCCRGTRSDYKVAVGRSRQIEGPYVDQDGRSMLEGGGSIILHGSGDVHGPGHCSVLDVDGREVLVHHMYDGRRGGVAVLQLRPIAWTADDWPQVGPPMGE